MPADALCGSYTRLTHLKGKLLGSQVTGASV